MNVISFSISMYGYKPCQHTTRCNKTKKTEIQYTEQYSAQTQKNTAFVCAAISAKVPANLLQNIYIIHTTRPEVSHGHSFISHLFHLRMPKEMHKDSFIDR